ncbi:MAG: hypothetical protein EA412_14310 [Chitinophagaceae bacterium]|nr:MAG: hypothetical protein EA412_14310 [Chitinophagaceae bacterium]
MHKQKNLKKNKPTENSKLISFLFAASSDSDTLRTFYEQAANYPANNGYKTEFLAATTNGKLPDSESERVKVSEKQFSNRADALTALTKEANGDYLVIVGENIPLSLPKADKLIKEAIRKKSFGIHVATRSNPKKGKKNLSRKLGNFGIRILTSLETTDIFSGLSIAPAATMKSVFSNPPLKKYPEAGALNMAAQAGYAIHEVDIPDEKQVPSGINKLLFFFSVLAFAFSSRIRWYISEPLKELSGKTHTKAVGAANKGIYRLGFAFTFLALLCTMLFLSKDYGISGDEWIQHKYGNEIFDFFAKGDDSATKETGRIQSYDDIFYYSGGFELFYTIFVRAFPDIDPYTIRHFWNAFVGFLAIFFAAMVGRFFGGWRMALVVLLLMAVSPRFFGHAMNNTKDIPFAFAYIMGVYYILEFTKRLPRISSKYAFFMLLSIGLAINARIGGLLVLIYMFFFTGLAFLELLRRKKITFNKLTSSIVPVGGTLAVVGLAGYIIGIIFWPYALQDPINNPLYSLSKMTDFHTVLSILYKGEHISSNQVPPDYIFHWIYITVPEIVLIGGIIFCISIPALLKKTGLIPVFILLFSFLFPPLYAIYQESNLYDGWRHFLFIYPSLGAIAGIGIANLLQTKNKNLKIGVWIILAIGMIFPLRYMIANHPHQVTYFNDLNGGIKSAYGNYETDYYMNSLKPASFWLIDEKGLRNTPDSVAITTNCWKEVGHYFRENTINTTVPYTHYNRRSELEWEYAIFYTRFINRNLLLNAFPPAGTIHIEEADGVPLTVVVKRVSNEDYLGIQALNRNDFSTALQHFRSYLEKDPLNDVVLERAALAALNTGDLQLAQSYLNNLLAIHPESFNGLYYAGVVSSQQGDLNNAIIYLERALDINPNVGQIYQLLGELHQALGNTAEANRYFQAAGGR